ncbi:30S ribosomal protein S8 [Candidatus Saccharibacteria bacterium]|nr:30S ribosomal protein S8 [Candidatus Saccharibacteria bacterium]MBR3323638.1 30S ribosomal protein S8 [Candidatus Saccharibacteria bacterium]
MSLQSTDQIADLITRIRNAILVGKREVSVPTSKLKVAVAEGLKKAHFIEDVKVEDGKPRGTLTIIINAEGENAKITEIAKVSKPGRRVYAGADELPKIKSGRGIVLVSTSKGIMSGEEARKNRLGGEILVKVY